MGIATAVAYGLKLVIMIANFIGARVKMKDEQKKRYLAFIAGLENDHKTLVSLKQDAEKQLEELKKESEIAKPGK